MSRLSKRDARRRRHRRIRSSLAGTAACPRMAVNRSDTHLYVQLIDDDAQRTLVSVSTLDPAFRDTGLSANVEGAKVLGRMAAEQALATDIQAVVFDRGGFKYHGRIKALAEAAREAGLRF